MQRIPADAPPRIPAHVTLRALRQIRGLTAPALAELLADRGVKVDPDHILAVELGHSNAGTALRVAWADELGVGPRDIRFGDEMRELIASGVGANERASAKRRARSEPTLPGALDDDGEAGEAA